MTVTRPQTLVWYLIVFRLFSLLNLSRYTVIRAAFLLILLSTSVCSAQSKWRQLGIDEFNVAANSKIEILVSSHGRWMSRTQGTDWILRGELPGPAYRVLLDESGGGLITGKGFCVVTSDGFKTTRFIE